MGHYLKRVATTSGGSSGNTEVKIRQPGDLVVTLSSYVDPSLVPVGTTITSTDSAVRAAFLAKQGVPSLYDLSYDNSPSNVSDLGFVPAVDTSNLIGAAGVAGDLHFDAAAAEVGTSFGYYPINIAGYSSSFHYSYWSSGPFRRIISQTNQEQLISVTGGFLHVQRGAVYKTTDHINYDVSLWLKDVIDPVKAADVVRGYTGPYVNGGAEESCAFTCGSSNGANDAVIVTGPHDKFLSFTRDGGATWTHRSVNWAHSYASRRMVYFTTGTKYLLIENNTMPESGDGSFVAFHMYDIATNSITYNVIPEYNSNTSLPAVTAWLGTDALMSIGYHVSVNAQTGTLTILVGAYSPGKTASPYGAFAITHTYNASGLGSQMLSNLVTSGTAQLTLAIFRTGNAMYAYNTTSKVLFASVDNLAWTTPGTLSSASGTPNDYGAVIVSGDSVGFLPSMSGARTTNKTASVAAISTANVTGWVQTASMGNWAHSVPVVSSSGWVQTAREGDDGMMVAAVIGGQGYIRYSGSNHIWWSTGGVNQSTAWTKTSFAVGNGTASPKRMLGLMHKPSHQSQSGLYPQVYGTGTTTACTTMSSYYKSTSGRHFVMYVESVNGTAPQMGWLISWDDGYTDIKRTQLFYNVTGNNYRQPVILGYDNKCYVIQYHNRVVTVSVLNEANNTLDVIDGTIITQTGKAMPAVDPSFFRPFGYVVGTTMYIVVGGNVLTFDGTTWQRAVATVDGAAASNVFNGSLVTSVLQNSDGSILAINANGTYKALATSPITFVTVGAGGYCTKWIKTQTNWVGALASGVINVTFDGVVTTTTYASMTPSGTTVVGLCDLRYDAATDTAMVFGFSTVNQQFPIIAYSSKAGSAWVANTKVFANDKVPYYNGTVFMSGAWNLASNISHVDGNASVDGDAAKRLIGWGPRMARALRVGYVGKAASQSSFSNVYSYTIPSVTSAVSGTIYQMCIQ